MTALDRIPLASVLVVLGALGGVYALVSGDIDYQEFLTGLGILSGGGAALGYVRNQAGKGTP